MSSEFGRTLRVGVFGQSHGAAIGVTIDGLPAGERIDLAELQAFLDRRKPGKSPLSTARKEADAPEFLSGLRDGVTCGSPLCAVIYNSNQHSSDYAELADKPRPSHADYTAWVKWGGQADMRGGGHFSGRLTAPLCIAGGIAKQILARRGVFVGAHLAAVGAEDDEAFPLYPTDELFRAVAVLVEKGISIPEIHNNVYNAYTEGRARLFGYVINRKMEIIQDGTVAYMSLMENEMRRFQFQQGDSEGFVNYALTIKKMKMSAMFLAHRKFIRVSLRSRGDVDVNLFARKYFNGGGHKNAAGGKSFVSMQETIDHYIKSVKEFAQDGHLG